MATYTRRGDRWLAQIYKRGVRKAKTFDTKTMARTWATRMEAEIEAGAASGRLSARGRTVGDLIRRYKEEVAPVKDGAGRRTPGSIC